MLLPPRARVTVLVLASVFASVFATVRAEAQRSLEDDEFLWPAGELWSLRLDADLAYGRALSARCERCAPPDTWGAAGRWSLGLPVHPRMVLGWEQAHHWRQRWWLYSWHERTAPAVDLRGGFVRFYPSSVHTFSVQAHAGRTNYDWRAGHAEGWDQNRRVRLKGWAFGGAIGYDAWPGPLARVGLAPVVSVWHAPGVRGRLTSATGGSVPRRASYTTLRLGLGLTVR